MNPEKEKANKLLQQGQLLDAKGVFAGLCAANLGDLEAWAQLAAINGNLGLYEEAIECCRRLVEIDPNLAFGYFTMGTAQLALQQLDAAAESYQKALQLEPRHAGAAHNLGRIRQMQGRMDDAIACFQRAIDGAPGLGAAHIGLGQTLEARGRHQEALEAYQRALTIQPGVVEVLMSIGRIYAKLGAVDAAIEWFSKAVQADASFVRGYCAIGALLADQGKLDEALEQYQKALSIDSAYPEALAGQGYIYEMRGDYERAYEGIRSLVEKGTESVQAVLVYMSLCSRFDCCRRAIEAAKQLLAKPALSLDQRMPLLFGLGDVCDGQRQYDDAFEYYREANASQPSTFSPRAYAAYIDRLIEVCDEAFFATVPRASNGSDRPLFIVGMPRSGTSLVEQILASHPQVCAGGELTLIQELVSLLPQLTGGTAHYPDCLSSLDQGMFDHLARRYLDRLAYLSSDARIGTDKMWVNFEHLGLISLLFPRARVIHCRRNPMDSCLSLYFKNFSARVACASDLEHIGRFWKGCERLMHHWQNVIDIPLLEVQYEQLVASPETVIRAVVEFCDLPWDDHCLEFYKTERHPGTVSHAQVRQPIYTSSVDRWKNYARHLGPLRAVLGVDTD